MTAVLFVDRLVECSQAKARLSKVHVETSSRTMGLFRQVSGLGKSQLQWVIVSSRYNHSTGQLLLYIWRNSGMTSRLDCSLVYKFEEGLNCPAPVMSCSVVCPNIWPSRLAPSTISKPSVPTLEPITRPRTNCTTLL
jgi:hypothetical protein